VTTIPTTTSPAAGIGGISWLWIIVIAVIVIAVILVAFLMLKRRDQAGEMPCDEEDWKLE
jgi:flagellar basal body-associated protein FliL